VRAHAALCNSDRDDRTGNFLLPVLIIWPRSYFSRGKSAIGCKILRRVKSGGGGGGALSVTDIAAQLRQMDGLVQRNVGGSAACRTGILTFLKSCEHA
jgi:hypothetical protein